MSRIKIGQIGTAHGHAEGKLAVYRRSPDYEVVGVVEPDARLREAAARHPTYADLRWLTLDELLSVPGLEAVAIETEVGGLLPAAEAAIAAGQHIHLDKPPGDDLPRFRRLLDQAAAKHLLVQLGYMYRYSPAILKLRQWLDESWLGEPFEVHAVMSKVVAPSQRRGLAAYSGGMMFELGCHLIDLVVGILGRPERVTAYSQHAAPADDGLADNMLAVLEYPRALASVKSSALEVEGFARRHLVVCGTQGTCHIQPLDAPAIELALDRPRGEFSRGRHRIELGDYPRYVGDAADMARIIRGEKDTDYSYEHDLTVQETVLLASNPSIG